MKLTFVVQRYGTEILGGSESHARYVVERLAPDYDIEVVTTCAQDYWSWENVYPEGATEVNGIRVRRFPVIAQRDPDFSRLSAQRFGRANTLAEEVEWVQKQGPWAPGLLDYVAAQRDARDVFIFFTYIYYPTLFGLPRVADKALLVPTAHDEPPIYFNLYKWLFHAPRGILFNTEEERRMVQRLFGNEHVPNSVVGLGVEMPTTPDPERFRRQYGIEGPYFLYLGRIVSSKGCDELLQHFSVYQQRYGGEASLVMLGKSEMELPRVSWLHYGGYIAEELRFDAIAGAEAMIVPSRYESLSMITLEAWAVGRPTICAAASEVVRGMSQRSNGGLFYHDANEFAEALHLLHTEPQLANQLGAQGRRFVADTYHWDQVLSKYHQMIAMVAETPWR